MATGLRVAQGVHEKTPDEVTALTITFADGLVTGETVLSLDGAATVIDDGTTGLVIDSTQIVTPLVNFVVSGGVAGNIYWVFVRINTNLGQKLEGAVKIVLRDAIVT